MASYRTKKALAIFASVCTIGFLAALLHMTFGYLGIYSSPLSQEAKEIHKIAVENITSTSTETKKEVVDYGEKVGVIVALNKNRFTKEITPAKFSITYNSFSKGFVIVSPEDTPEFHNGTLKLNSVYSLEDISRIKIESSKQLLKYYYAKELNIRYGVDTYTIYQEIEPVSLFFEDTLNNKLSLRARKRIYDVIERVKKEAERNE